MSKNKYSSIFSRQMEAIVFMNLQIFFAQFWKLGNIRSCDFFRPIARERNYLIDYNEPNITGEYQALPKEMLNEKQQQMKKKTKTQVLSFQDIQFTLWWESKWQISLPFHKYLNLWNYPYIHLNRYLFLRIDHFREFTFVYLLFSLNKTCQSLIYAIMTLVNIASRKANKSNLMKTIH